MTILSAHTASRIRNRSMGVLHLIAADERCEVSDILALLVTTSNPSKTAVPEPFQRSETTTPSQPQRSSQAPAAGMSDPAPADMQAEVSAPQTSADHSPETAHDILGGLPVAAAESNAEETGQEGGPANTATGKSGEASASPAPVKRTRTKGRGKVVEASIRGNPDWTDLMHAEHLGVDPAYIRRTAVRLGLKLASRLSLRKAKQAATTEALKAAPAKPQELVERAGPPTPRPEPKQPPVTTAGRKSIKQQVADTHREHPDWSAEQIADHIGAKIGSVRQALHDARTAAGTAEVEIIPPATPQTPVAPPPTGDTRTLTERVRALHQQHPTWTATMLAKELGAKPTSVSTILSMVRGKPAAPVEQPQFSGRREMVEHYGAIAKRLGKPS